MEEQYGAVEGFNEGEGDSEAQPYDHGAVLLLETVPTIKLNQ